MIELKIGKPSFGFLPYESHIEGILTGNNLNKIDYYLSMLDMEAICLQYGNKRIYDFFIGRNIQCNNIYREYSSRIDLSSEEALIPFLVDALAKGSFCYLSVDTFCINKYISYKKEHIMHSPLVSGIDLDRNLIKISDFFDFTNYGIVWVPINEFIKGYFAIQKVVEEGDIEETENWILKIEKINICKNKTEICDRMAINKVFKGYVLGSEEVKDSMDTFSYINYRLANHKVFQKQSIVEQNLSVTGIKVYEYLKLYIEESIKEPQVLMRIKNLVLLKKHFDVYKKIVQVLGINSEKVQACIEKAQLFLLIGMKINRSNQINNKLYFDMISIVRELKEMEYEIISEILSM
ncbi:TPA: hypothetical protein ACPXLI_001546 [Streptococcus pneumoniae]